MEEKILNIMRKDKQTTVLLKAVPVVRTQEIKLKYIQLRACRGCNLTVSDGSSTVDEGPLCLIPFTFLHVSRLTTGRIIRKELRMLLGLITLTWFLCFVSNYL